MTSHSDFMRQHAQTEYLDPDTRITRVRQSVDDLEVMIESARSIIRTPKVSFIKDQTQPSPSNKYHIHIDHHDNNSSLDFNISFDTRSPIHQFDTRSPIHQFDTRSPIHQFDTRSPIHQFDSSRYSQNKISTNTRCQTVRKEEFQISPITQKQQKSFGQLSNMQSRVVNFRKQSSKPESPKVYQYSEDSIRNDQYLYTPISAIDANSSQKQISQHQQPKSPQLTLEKRAQQMIQQPPSMSEIQFTNSRAEPIIVPISSLPKNTLNYSSKNSTYNRSLNSLSKQKGPKKVKVNLNQTMKTIRGEDRFLLQKNRYLKKLQKQEEKARLSRSRTLSKSKRPLSPSCQQITNRLYYGKTNEQPCPKYQHYLAVIERLKMKDKVSDYTFVRRYLNEQEICEICQCFQREGVPQHKWLVKIVDVVYSKFIHKRSY